MLEVYILGSNADSPGLQGLSLPQPLLNMISDATLTTLANGFGITAFMLIVAYHFLAANSKRAVA